MKSKIFLMLFVAITQSLFAQQKTSDIVTYKAPSGWQEKQGNDNISYSKIDGASWAQIAIYQHRNSEGDIQTDFDKDWNELVANGKTISSPEKTEPKIVDGWAVMSGSGVWQYNGSNVASMLTVYSNNNVCIAVLCNSTALPYLKEYQSLLETLHLDAGSLNIQQPTTTSTTQNENSSIIGIWLKSGSIRQGNSLEQQWGSGTGGYMTDEYIFNTNGSYQFFSKIFSMTMDKIILIKESGNYKIEDNNLTISPAKSVIESYTKKDGADKWGKLLSSEKRTLEKVAYTFTKHYFEGIKKWNLVLQAKTPTQRDGPFSTNTTFTNAYYFSAPDKNNEMIDLPPRTKINTESLQQTNLKAENILNANTNNASIVGLWCNYVLETTGYYINGQPQYTAGYLRKEYKFNANGTYAFRNKQWLTKAPDITFQYETGKYSANGNQLIITPENGKAGFWAKTNSSKEWGKLVKYSDYKLEKTTYVFEIIQDATYGNSIVLKPGKPTTRDGGKFNAKGDSYEFHYKYREIESLIDNPPGFKTGFENNSSTVAPVQQINANSSASKNNFPLIGKIWEGTSLEKTGSGNMQFNTGGFFSYQYKFNADDTYRFVNVNASSFTDTKSLNYETGTYSVNGNQLTISPSQGYNEEWSKIGKTSNGNSDMSNRKINETWGEKVKSANRKLEKYTYTFSIGNNGGKTALIMERTRRTEREGEGKISYLNETATAKSVKLPVEM